MARIATADAILLARPEVDQGDRFIVQFTSFDVGSTVYLVPVVVSVGGYV